MANKIACCEKRTWDLKELFRVAADYGYLGMHNASTNSIHVIVLASLCPGMLLDHSLVFSFHVLSSYS